MKIPVINDPEYTAYIEVAYFGLIVHIDVHGKWTKTLRDKILYETDQWHGLYKMPVFANHYPEQGEKHRKFLKLMRFSPVGHGVDGNGVECELWVRPPTTFG